MLAQVVAGISEPARSWPSQPPAWQATSPSPRRGFEPPHDGRSQGLGVGEQVCAVQVRALDQQPFAIAGRLVEEDLGVVGLIRLERGGGVAAVSELEAVVSREVAGSIFEGRDGQEAASPPIRGAAVAPVRRDDGEVPADGEAGDTDAFGADEQFEVPKEVEARPDIEGELLAVAQQVEVRHRRGWGAAVASEVQREHRDAGRDEPFEDRVPVVAVVFARPELVQEEEAWPPVGPGRGLPGGGELEAVEGRDRHVLRCGRRGRRGFAVDGQSRALVTGGQDEEKGAGGTPRGHVPRVPPIAPPPNRIHRPPVRPHLVLLVVACGVEPAWAHGVYPEALEVSRSGPGDDEYLLRTTFGLVVPAGDGGHRLVCEELFSESPTAAARLGVGSWLVGASAGLHRSEDGCGWAEVGAPLADAFITRILTDESLPSTAWVSTYTWNGDNGLWRTDDGGLSWVVEVASLPGVRVRDALPKPGGGWVLSERADAGPVVRIVEPGEDRSIPVPVAIPTDSVRLLAADERGVFVSDQGPEFDRLLHLSWDGVFSTVLEPEGDLAGLALDGDRAWLAVRGVGLLESGDGGSTWPTQAEGPVPRCLHGSGSTLLRCQDAYDEGAFLYRGLSGALGTPVVTKEGITGLHACPNDSDLRLACGGLWEAIAFQAGLGPPEPSTPEPEDAATGCSTAGGGGSLLAWILLGSVVWTRRKAVGALALLGCAQEPSLELVLPAQDSTVCGAPLHVETKVVGFTLTDELGDAGAAAGHLHVTMNGQDAGQFHDEVFDIEGTWPDGAWRIQLALAGLDHADLDPPVVETVFFAVDGEECP